MPIDFYYMPASPSCRSVRLTAKAIGVRLTLKLTDVSKGEHLTKEYLKLNPQHTIPTITDHGFSLSESRAILQYLAEKYAKSDALYPKDPTKRAVVNHRLFFDMGTLSQSFVDVFYPMMFAGAPKDAEKVKKLDSALGFLNGFLEKTKYAAGDDITIADHALVASVSTIDAFGVILSKYPNILRWYEDCKKKIDGYQELNGDDAKVFGEFFKSTQKK